MTFDIAWVFFFFWARASYGADFHSAMPSDSTLFDIDPDQYNANIRQAIWKLLLESKIITVRDAAQYNIQMSKVEDNLVDAEEHWNVYKVLMGEKTVSDSPFTLLAEWEWKRHIDVFVVVVCLRVMCNEEFWIGVGGFVSSCLCADVKAVLAWGMFLRFSSDGQFGLKLRLKKLDAPRRVACALCKWWLSWLLIPWCHQFLVHCLTVCIWCSSFSRNQLIDNCAFLYVCVCAWVTFRCIASSSISDQFVCLFKAYIVGSRFFAQYERWLLCLCHFCLGYIHLLSTLLSQSAGANLWGTEAEGWGKNSRPSNEQFHARTPTSGWLWIAIRTFAIKYRRFVIDIAGIASSSNCPKGWCSNSCCTNLLGRANRKLQATSMAATSATVDLAGMQISDWHSRRFLLQLLQIWTFLGICTALARDFFLVHPKFDCYHYH